MDGDRKTLFDAIKAWSSFSEIRSGLFDKIADEQIQLIGKVDERIISCASPRIWNLDQGRTSDSSSIDGAASNAIEVSRPFWKPQADHVHDCHEHLRSLRSLYSRLIHHFEMHLQLVAEAEGARLAIEKSKSSHAAAGVSRPETLTTPPSSLHPDVALVIPESTSTASQESVAKSESFHDDSTIVSTDDPAEDIDPNNDSADNPSTPRFRHFVPLDEAFQERKQTTPAMNLPTQPALPFERRIRSRALSVDRSHNRLRTAGATEPTDPQSPMRALPGFLSPNGPADKAHAAAMWPRVESEERKGVIQGPIQEAPLNSTPQSATHTQQRGLVPARPRQVPQQESSTFYPRDPGQSTGDPTTSNTARIRAHRHQRQRSFESAASAGSSIDRLSNPSHFSSKDVIPEHDVVRPPTAATPQEDEVGPMSASAAADSRPSAQENEQRRLMPKAAVAESMPGQSEGFDGGDKASVGSERGSRFMQIARMVGSSSFIRGSGLSKQEELAGKLANADRAAKR